MAQRREHILEITDNRSKKVKYLCAELNSRYHSNALSNILSDVYGNYHMVATNGMGKDLQADKLKLVFKSGCTTGKIYIGTLGHHIKVRKIFEEDAEFVGPLGCINSAEDAYDFS